MKYDVELVNRAKSFALERHGNQEHGSLMIKDHLIAVTNKIREQIKHEQFYHLDLDIEYVTIVGWLHDILEDTNVYHDEMKQKFGDSIYDDVCRVTDGGGKNRMERHLNTYYRTRQSNCATLVKMCDRWHNQERSIVNGEKWAKMYTKEYIYFKFALYRPGFNDILWAELDEQYVRLCNMTHLSD